MAYVHMVVRKSDGEIPENIRGEMGTDVWTVVGIPISHYMLEFILPTGVDNGTRASIKIDGDGCQTLYDEIDLAPDVNVTLQPERAASRTGLVQLNGKAWADDQGEFLPFGTTLFWALGGWHRGERDRVRANLNFIQHSNFDYLRILGQVDWKDEEIDPRWPDYQDQLASLIDCAYDEYGLRVQLTAIGGGSDDPVAAARKMADVVSTRREKVIMLEAVNEGNASHEEAVAIAKVFATVGGVPFGTGLGDQGIEAIKESTASSRSTVMYLHTERGGDNTRMVRQCWDFHHFHEGAPVDNEPPGPASSVAQLKDSFALACLRAGAVICGAGAFCFHTGSGVFGRTYPYADGFRYANLWEVPGIDDMVIALQNAVAHLPPGIPNWHAFNQNQPVDIPRGNVDKLYGARMGPHFAELAIAADGPVTFRAQTTCTLDVVNPADGGIVAHVELLPAGATMTVAGLWSYVLVGQER